MPRIITGQLEVEREDGTQQQSGNDDRSEEDEPIDDLDHDVLLMTKGAVELLELVARILELSMALIEETLAASRLRGLILTYAAVRGLGPQGQWLDPQQYIPVFSQMIYCAELNWRRLFGMSIGRQAPPPKFSSWSKDNTTWRQLNQALLGQARQLLGNEWLICCPDQPALSARQMQAVMVETQPGFFFGEDARNRLEGLGVWLGQRVKQSPTHIRSLVTTMPAVDESGVSHHQSHWNRVAIKRYQQHVERFRELLLLLVHLTARWPGRGPEILGVTYRNMEMARHVFIPDGMVLILTWYHKAQGRVGRRPICRFVAPVVGDLLLTVVVVVIPFVQFLQSRVRLATEAELEPGAYPTFLFSSDGQTPWSTERFSKTPDQAWRAELGMSMNVSSWRQMAVAIDREFLHEEGRQLEGEDSGDEVVRDPLPRRSPLVLACWPSLLARRLFL
ncbi:MAG: hypothetical protein M1826_005696 [Phylliscum demangeonii]|nr:MAG: hypothetical protein M1826_005696 [Phylliscum demangeonii]